MASLVPLRTMHFFPPALPYGQTSAPSRVCALPPNAAQRRRTRGGGRAEKSGSRAANHGGDNLTDVGVLVNCEQLGSGS